MTSASLDPKATPHGYVAPKFDGRRMQIRARVSPSQHRQLHLLAEHYGCTVSEMVGAFIDHQFNKPSLLDHDPDDGSQDQEELPVSA